MKRGCFSSCAFPARVALFVYGCVVCGASAEQAEGPHPKILWNVKAYPTPPDAFPTTIAVPAVEFSPDSEQIITAGYNGEIKFLNRSNGAVAQTILAHTGIVHGLSISKNGLLLASGGADRMLNLWRVSDGTLLRSINAHTTAVYSVAFSPDASLVISGGGLDYQLKIWRTSDGELVRSIQGTRGQEQDSFGGMQSVAFAPNGEYVGGSGLGVWKVDGTVIRTSGGLDAEARRHVKFSPDSTRVFGTIPYGIVGYVIADGTRVQPFTTSSYPPSAISPDGRSLVTVSFHEMMWAVIPRREASAEPNFGQIQYYDCADGECSLMFTSLAFDPRMRTVAAGTESGEVLLFELPIWISGIQGTGNQASIQWQGGSGNYQLQKFVASSTWQDIEGPLTNNAASANMNSPTAILRVRDVEH